MRYAIMPCVYTFSWAASTSFAASECATSCCWGECGAGALAGACPCVAWQLVASVTAVTAPCSLALPALPEPLASTFCCSSQPQKEHCFRTSIVSSQMESSMRRWKRSASAVFWGGGSSKSYRNVSCLATGSKLPPAVTPVRPGTNRGTSFKVEPRPPAPTPVALADEVAAIEGLFEARELGRNHDNRKSGAAKSVSFRVAFRALAELLRPSVGRNEVLDAMEAADTAAADEGAAEVDGDGGEGGGVRPPPSS